MPDFANERIHVLPRPHFRLPLWAAFAIPASAYVIRSVSRGFDFKPDMPVDAIVLVLLVAVVALVAWSRSHDDAGEAPVTTADASCGSDALSTGADTVDAPSDDATKGPVG